MGLSIDCRECLYQRQIEKIQDQTDEEKKSEYLRKVQKLINESGQLDTAPVVTERISKLHQEYFQALYSFDELKQTYNQAMLSKEEQIRETIKKAGDPLKAAILYARVGNYIDFGALGSVDDQKLNDFLAYAVTEELDNKTYTNFQTELKAAKQVIYLTDNCGEIVLDKLLIEQMKIYNTECKVTVIVRGEPVLNDATVEDARMTGIDQLADVIGNGTGIPGTSLAHVDPYVREKIQSADLIVSKGQGNFETMNQCGLNVFYLFLCKCSLFVKRFGLEQFKGVFVRDYDLI